MSELFHNSLLLGKIIIYLHSKNCSKTIKEIRKIDSKIDHLCDQMKYCYGCITKASAYDLVKHTYPPRSGCMFKYLVSFIEQRCDSPPKSIGDIIRILRTKDYFIHTKFIFRRGGALNEMQSEILHDLVKYFNKNNNPTEFGEYKLHLCKIRPASCPIYEIHDPN